jgi:hypothetical protein
MMRRPTVVPLDRMKFPLTLAGELRTAFADVVSVPLPGRLAALMRRLNADRNELSGEEPGPGASATETSSRIDRRGRRRAAEPDGGAARRREWPPSNVKARNRLVSRRAVWP